MIEDRLFVPASRSPNTGFSLLEVVLALALSAVIISIVAGGIEFHLRNLTIRKTRIEEAQLARAVLHRIASDLRAVVVNRPSESSATDGTPTGTNDVSDGTEGASGAEEDVGTTTSADDIIASTALPETTGVYGTLHELQIDVNRIPRYEEYAMLTESSDTMSSSTVSDTKTISYVFLGGNKALGGSSYSSQSLNLSQLDTLGLPPNQTHLQGLARRVVDRSVTRFATQSGDFSYLDQQVELMAPEVTFVEFRYFDGQQWQIEWNTDAMGGLPWAVEITVMIGQPQTANGNNSQRLLQSNTVTSMGMSTADPSQVYRLVVHLPAADKTLPDQQDTGGDTSGEGGA